MNSFSSHYTNPNFNGYSSSASSSALVTNKKNMSTNNNEEKKRKNKKNNNINGTAQVKLSTDPQSVAARHRRHRISERFKILKSLIPGGESKNMDTVSMLEEAIQYVKLLKAQIWLHQTMISFENCADEYPHQHQHQHQEDHQHLITFDHHDHQLSMLPHQLMQNEMLGFDDSSFKLEAQGEDHNMLSFPPNHLIYP